MAQLTTAKASTLIESLVVMAIVSICIGIAYVVIEKLAREDNPLLKFKVLNKVQQVIYESKTNKVFYNRAFEEEGTILEITLEKYRGYENIRILDVKAYSDSKRLILERRELVRIE